MQTPSTNTSGKPEWGSWEVTGPYGEHEPWLCVKWTRNDWNYKSCQTDAGILFKDGIDPFLWVHSVTPEKAQQLADLLNSIEIDYMNAWGDGG